MGLWYYGPLRQQTTDCLLHFMCAENKTHGVSVCLATVAIDRKTHEYLFCPKFLSLLNPISSHTSLLIDTCILNRKKCSLNWKIASVADAHPLWGLACLTFQLNELQGYSYGLAGV